MTATRASSLLNQALIALTEQRSALVSGDAAAIGVSGENLATALAGLRNVRQDLTPAELADLQQAASALALNAALLGRVSVANQRALTTLFEPAATYGLPSQSGLATPTRTLRSA